MRSKWVIQNLNTYFPSSMNSSLSPFRTQIHHYPSSKTSTFLLNHVDISTLLSLCGKQGYLHLGSSLHASIIKNHEFFNPQEHPSFRNALVIWNSLLVMYSKCGVLVDAVKLFNDMPVRDTISWNTIISGFLSSWEFEIGLGFFKQMRELGFYRLDKATLTTVLSACDKPEMRIVKNMIHCLVFLCGFEREVTVGNALITSCFNCGCFMEGRQVFDEMLERNVVTWTAIISGLAQNELYIDSLRLFVEMNCGSVEPNSLTYSSLLMACSGLRALREGSQIHGLVWKLGMQGDLCIESALMDMYSKCGSMEDAWRIFEFAEQLDEVSMTVILVGFAHNGFQEEAMQIFMKVVKEGIDIDPNMISAVLGVFGVDTSLGLGKQIHSLVIKRNFGCNPFVSNGLINMYSKCGYLGDSMKVFCRMPERNSVSWNSIIAAFARHGDGSKVLELYADMQLEGVELTDVTFLSLLHACSHAGLVDKGMGFLKSMTEIHRINPRAEHYACIVDMLGRAGLLDEAQNLIEGLPVKPDVLIWQAMLGACSIHGETELGKYAAEQLFMSAPGEPAPYILLANIYSSKGKWRERARTIKRMKETGVSKDTGLSWIEIEKKVHSFVVEDRMHPQAENIYKVLKELSEPMLDEGYVPDKRYVLYYLNQNEKE